MLLHLAPSADDEPLFGDVEAVERAAGNMQLLKDGNTLAGDAAVADQERRAR
ncbi:hypothetical protein EDF69_003603 [Sphingomonas sp. JUb134]|nr:hypothetical protein [Sphingomonas sp. JUb134]